MKVLFITSKSPYPALDGGAMATKALLEGLLSNGISVHLFVLETYKHPFQPSNIPAHFKDRLYYQSVSINTHVQPLDALLHLIQNKSYNLSRFYSADAETQLVKLLQTTKFDRIHFESLYATVYATELKKHTTAKFIYRAHNIENQIWQNLSSETKSWPYKAYLKLLANQLLKYESRILELFDLILPITSTDAQWFKNHGFTKKMTLFPFGIDLKNSSSTIEPNPHSLFFIGALNWKPNQDGLYWFLNKVWPIITSQVKDVHFYVAGRFLDQLPFQLNFPNVTVVGEVPDQFEFMQTHNVFVVPLLSGSGMRVKIIEGLAIGKPLVTTSKGVEGIEAIHQQHLLIADNEQAFANAVIQLLENPVLAQHLSKNGRLLVQERYNNQQNLLQVIAAYQQL